MKKFLPIALGIALGGVAVASYAADDDQLAGSDTLKTMSETIFSLCSGEEPLVYVGGGSSNGERAMLAGRQEVAPMSRFFDPKRACLASPTESEGLLVALDGLAIVEDEDNAQCAEDGVAFEGCFDVSDLNGEPGVQCTDCDSAAEYCFDDEFDALRILFGGLHQEGGDDVANQDCDSDVRFSLAANWAAVHAGECATGECDSISHLWRRDDLSGTTDTFLSLLDLPGIGDTPFCNGNFAEDIDPIRVACDEADDVCQADGTSGLLLSLFVPELEAGDEAKAFPTKACVDGKFTLAEALRTDLDDGSVRFDCPERGDFSIAGLCLAPQAEDDSFDCLSDAENPNVFFANLSDDARLFNLWLREADGDLVRDLGGRPELNSYYRMRTDDCVESSSTKVMGCLAGEIECSMGFAGREAADGGFGAVALAVGGVFPTDENVRLLLDDPVPAGVYPLARGLFFNSLVGFENVTDATEAALTACYSDETTAEAGALSAGFISLDMAPRCEDFDETVCNGFAISCDDDADCGTTGATCVGGSCDYSCTDDADCGQGRTCIANRCDFASNTDACAP